MQEVSINSVKQPALQVRESTSQILQPVGESTELGGSKWWTPMNSGANQNNRPKKNEKTNLGIHAFYGFWRLGDLKISLDSLKILKFIGNLKGM